MIEMCYQPISLELLWHRNEYTAFLYFFSFLYMKTEIKLKTAANTEMEPIDTD